MNFNNTSMIFMFVILLLILFISKEFRKNKKTPFEKIFHQASLSFDEVHQNIDEKCFPSLNKQTFRKPFTKLLNKLKQYGFYNSKFIIQNQKSCLHFNENLNVCYDYPNIKDPNLKSEKICIQCNEIERQVKHDIGFLLKYNLIKTYFDKNTIFIYKRYLCSNKQNLIIGIQLQDA